MSNSLPESERIEASTFLQTGMREILAWLDTQQPENAADSLALLLVHLATVRTSQIAPKQRSFMLERLYTRSVSVEATLLPLLNDVSLPIPRKTRHLIRSMQDLLRALAEDLLSTLDNVNGHTMHSPSQAPDLTLWRSLYALAQHLLISNMVSSPAGVGIWQQLHRAYGAAIHLQVTGNQPESASSSLQCVYFSAILLGCAQPASFTASEVDFVATYLKTFADQIDFGDTAASETPTSFWVDPTRDAPAVASARKPPPPATPVHYFSCDRLVALLKKQLSALNSGDSPQQINLPAFSGTPAGRGVLRRLVTYWGEPGKRRFPRRRQNYRAALCTGLDSLWQLFQDGEAAPIETSSWMITNESPDGYAIMHVSGKMAGMSVGDVTAIRTESGESWQIGIVRWALSENQEHIELGLQILAPRAVPALLALPSATTGPRRFPVLILPKIRALRATELLVVPSGALDNKSSNLILVVERENIEVREIKSTRLDEQNSHIEVFSIETDTNPD